MLLLVGLLSLSVWNVNPQGLLVGAGFLGIVVGFAARQTLGSLIADAARKPTPLAVGGSA
jgi:small-conductance mechanosensitive channel